MKLSGQIIYILIEMRQAVAQVIYNLKIKFNLNQWKEILPKIFDQQQNYIIFENRIIQMKSSR